MSDVIQVLETMASDANLIDEENISRLLITAEISIEQQQAFTDKNAERLAETVSDLPEIIAHVQVLPEEDEDDKQEDSEDDNLSTNKLLASSF